MKFSKMIGLMALFPLSGFAGDITLQCSLDHAYQKPLICVANRDKDGKEGKGCQGELSQGRIQVSINEYWMTLSVKGADGEFHSKASIAADDILSKLTNGALMLNADLSDENTIDVASVCCWK